MSRVTSWRNLIPSLLSPNFRKREKMEPLVIIELWRAGKYWFSFPVEFSTGTNWYQVKCDSEIICFEDSFIEGEEPCFSVVPMLINVSLGGVDTLIGKPLFDTKVLLDSGSSLNLISENLVDTLQIPLVVKDKPFDIRLADKSTVWQIYAETMPIWLVIGSHKEKLVFNVFPSLFCRMIIGMPWLEFHNPEIDW